MAKQINVVKASGEQVLFDRNKLSRSLKRSGADQYTIDEVIKELEQQLYDGIPTHLIYKMAFKLLKKSAKHYAAKYGLKNSIMELGPSGFPFERYVSEILKREGYDVEVDKIVRGKCVYHEIDIIADKNNKRSMIECKYHNSRGIKSDVKIPLYIHSRFQDVEYDWVHEEKKDIRFHEGWVVTNTRFTEDAIQYGHCVGLHLLGWDHPKDKGLREMIEASGLHPVTCLTTLSRKEKQCLLDREIVLCRTLHNNGALLKKCGISPIRTKRILQEVNKILNSNG